MPVGNDIWALPNFAGELFTADSTNTPLLTMSGGMTGGKVTANFEFPVSSEYTLPAAAQPSITETASLSAPSVDNIARTQQYNVCQIHHERVSVSYVKQSNLGRMSGLNTIGQSNNAEDELAFQQARKLEKIARDIELSFVQGAYAKSNGAGVANTTRGLVEVCQIAGGTNKTGAGAVLDVALVDAFLLNMYNNGASFKDLIFYVPGTVKQKLSKLYGYAPQDREVGGVNVEQLETDFGKIGIVVSRFAPALTLLAVEMSQIAPVFMEVPGKGVMFYEELSKTGASEDGQIFGQVGLDYGAHYSHGRLFNFTV